MVKHSRASAVWKGDLRNGTGAFSAASGVFQNVPYSFKTRFEDAPGTNPEELIAAAEAACFSMALSGELSKAGITQGTINTTATTTLDTVEGKPTVTEIHLTAEVQAGAVDKAAVQQAADVAKKNCPISRLLKANIILDLTVK
jgi:osmotically inducible protein OsmC